MALRILPWLACENDTGETRSTEMLKKKEITSADPSHPGFPSQTHGASLLGTAGALCATRPFISVSEGPLQCRVPGSWHRLSERPHPCASSCGELLLGTSWAGTSGRSGSLVSSDLFRYVSGEHKLEWMHANPVKHAAGPMPPGCGWIHRAGRCITLVS
jgi:hypothetical protein